MTGEQEIAAVAGPDSWMVERFVDWVAQSPGAGIALIVAIGGVLSFILRAIYKEQVRRTGTEELRQALAQQLRSEHVFENYHRRLGEVLDQAANVVGEGRGWRNTGRGFAVCLCIAYLYFAFAGMLAWVLLGVDGMGEFTFFEGLDWPSNPYLERGLIGLPSLAYLVWVARILMKMLAREPKQTEISSETSVRRAVAGVVTATVAGALALAGAIAVALAGAVAVAVTGAATVAVAVAVAVSGKVNAGALVFILLFVLLPYSNAVSDFISLRVSQWLGRQIEHNRRAAFAAAFGTGILDLLAAAVFLALVAGILCFAIAALAAGTGITERLQFAAYVDAAFNQPLTAGLWGTIMVFSTLIPTLYHFRMAMRALYLHLFHGPKNWAARILERKTPEHELQWTKVRLWLGFGQVTSAGGAVLLLWLIYEVFVVAGIDLPGELQNWCHRAIAAGQRFGGS